jgi:prepilin-type N-terminal cleavage/methylation domain-containing protein
MKRLKVKQSGFTLIEVLIAVGAVSLIAIGLAKVFSSTGETVRAGRRISNFNEYASLIERQLRDDVARMSREGFLVIRNRNTADQAGTISVRLSPDQSQAFARPRRVDQLMFFASGNFTTLRDPIHPSRIPAGSAARIYYGHGLRNDPPDQPPSLDQHSGATSTQSSFGAANGPNEFASDWILLRHETALVDPATSSQAALPPGITEPAGGELADNDIQVGLQPAAASMFRNLSLVGPNPAPADGDLVRDGENVNTYPQFSSGIIDLATTNFSEMRQIILDAQPFTGISIPWDPERDSSVDGAANKFAFQRDAMPTAFNNVAASVTSNMKRWKIGALPAGYIDPLNLQTDRRMRCELTPPDLLGVITQGQPWFADEPWKRSDRMMLASSNFVPHCTEFIVEWSFGIVERDTGADDYGQLKWYGLERHIDPSDTSSPIVAAPYSRPAVGDVEYTHFQRIVRRDGSVVGRSVDPALVHFPPIETPPTSNFPPQNAPLYSCFGYLDPTYPEPALAADPQQRYPSSIPWAWPKLLRITVSLVDPSEPLRERTFQFVIELPEAKNDRF